MKAPKQQPPGFPFHTLSYGIYNDIYRHFGCLLVFEQPVPEDQRAALEEGLPWTLRERIWTGSLLYLGSEDWIDADLRLAYHPESRAELATLGYELQDFTGCERYNILVQLSEIEATDEDKCAFACELEQWLRKAHQQAPLLLSYTTDRPPTESFQNNNPEHLLADFIDRILPRLGQIWRAGELHGSDHAMIVLASIFDHTCAALLGRFLHAHPQHAITYQQPLLHFLEAILQANPHLPQKRWIAQLHPMLLANQPISQFKPPPLISA